MVFVFLLLLCCAVVAASSAASPALAAGGRPRPAPPSLRTVGCSACVLVLEEVRGLAAESRNEQAIAALLKGKVCPKLDSALQFVCDGLADNVAEIVKFLDGDLLGNPGKLCTKIDLCEQAPPPLEADGLPMPQFEIDLDKPPAERFGAIANRTEFWDPLVRIMDTMQAVLSDEVADAFFKLGDLALDASPQPYKGEMEGIAQATGIPRGFIMLLNIFYELTNACTSIVAQPSGANTPPIFSRNQDLGYGMGFTNILRNQTVHLRFTKGGKTAYEGVTFVGYVGLPTGSLAHKFAMSLDSRSVNRTLLGYAESVLRELIDRDAHVSTWVVRQVLDAGGDFETTIKTLSTVELITDVYMIVAGAKNMEGMVLARNQSHVRFSERLGKVSVKGGEPWFIIQTNYDPDKNAPAFDDRRYYAQKEIKAACGGTGGDAVTEKCLYDTLSVKPVLNLLSLYTAQVVPASGDSLSCHRRVCHGDCAV